MESAQRTTVTFPIRLSASAEKAIYIGEAFREKVGANGFFTEFLFIGLAEKQPGVADALLKANNISDFGTIWEKLPDADVLGWRVPPSFSGFPTPKPIADNELESLLSPSMVEVLNAARQLAEQNSVDDIRPGHLLYGILSAECYARVWLINSGVDVARARQQLETIPENQPITPATFSPNSPNLAINDVESKVDKLGFETSAIALAQTLLQSKTIPPLVIGIYGAWGSGKSTYMNRVKANLKALNPKVICIDYDAWEYTDSEKLWAGLVQTIANKLDAELGFWQRLRRFNIGLILKRLWWIVVITALLLMFGFLSFFIEEWVGQSLAATGIASLFLGTGVLIWTQLKEPLSESIKELLQQYPQPETEGVIHRIRKELETAVEDIIDRDQKGHSSNEHETTDKTTHKVFIFIDNLDRCQLEYIVDILEGIKLFLDKAIFYVFLAVDTRVLAEAIKMRYKDSENESLTREYIEKIVQFPIQVPRARLTGLVNFVDSQMDIKETIEQKTERQKNLVQQLQTYRETGSSIPQQRIETKPDATLRPDPLPDTIEEQTAIVEFADVHLDGNPRRIKRLLNTYRYAKIVSKWTTSQPVDTPEWQKTMIRWLGFTLRWPSFMAHVVKKVSSPEFPPASEFWKTAAEGFMDGERPSDDDLKQLTLTREQAILFADLAGHFLAENPTNNNSNTFRVEG